MIGNQDDCPPGQSRIPRPPSCGAGMSPMNPAARGSRIPRYCPPPPVAIPPAPRVAPQRTTKRHCCGAGHSQMSAKPPVRRSLGREMHSPRGRQPASSRIASSSSQAPAKPWYARTRTPAQRGCLPVVSDYVPPPVVYGPQPCPDDYDPDMVTEYYDSEPTGGVPRSTPRPRWGPAQQCNPAPQMCPEEELPLGGSSNVANYENFEAGLSTTIDGGAASAECEPEFFYQPSQSGLPRWAQDPGSEFRPPMQDIILRSQINIAGWQNCIPQERSRAASGRQMWGAPTLPPTRQQAWPSTSHQSTRRRWGDPVDPNSFADQNSCPPISQLSRIPRHPAVEQAARVSPWSTSARVSRIPRYVGTSSPAAVTSSAANWLNKTYRVLPPENEAVEQHTATTCDSYGTVFDDNNWSMDDNTWSMDDDTWSMDDDDEYHTPLCSPTLSPARESPFPLITSYDDFERNLEPGYTSSPIPMQKPPRRRWGPTVNPNTVFQSCPQPCEPYEEEFTQGLHPQGSGTYNWGSHHQYCDSNPE